MTKDVLDYFKTICSIPHPSGHEELYRGICTKS